MQAAVRASIMIFAIGAALIGCGKGPRSDQTGRRTIVVTYSILGSVVRDLVGDSFVVDVEIPNGLDPHEWEPSARDIERLNKADLVVQNGLGLEGGMGKSLRQAMISGVRFFTASDHIQVRTVGMGEGIPSGDADQTIGAPDPHFWTDPIAIKSAADALAALIKGELGVDLSARQKDLDARLDALDGEIRAEADSIPEGKRKLVTGHESLGYFARRYGFKLIGAVIPSLTTQAEASASEMAALKRLIVANGVKVVFTELGTPLAVTEALAKDAGVKTVPLATHSLPKGGTYFTFQRELARTIAESLK